MHNARKDNLMKNKKLFGALSLLFATGLILSACNNKKSESSTPTSTSGQPTSSSSEVRKFTVTFVVNGTTVQTSQVEAGSLAVYEGATPTKAGDAQAYRYFFRGWDKDITQPIAEDTTFTAVFAEYGESFLVDNFEAYADAGALHDDGKWVPAKYNNTTQQWDDDQGGTIDVSYTSREGLKAARFQSWANGVGYKFCKKLTAGTFTQAANALKFNLRTAAFNTVKIIVFTSPITIGTEEVVPSATYTMDIESSQYTEYTIPMAGEWAIWGDKAQFGTIANPVAGKETGIHQDDVVKMLTRIEFYIQGHDGSGQQQFSLLDNLRFVTLDDPSEEAASEMGQFTTYTGTAADGKTVIKVELGAAGAATATLVNLASPVVIDGTYSVHDDEITFTSADQGATLGYKATMVDGGVSLKFKAATGAQADFVGQMDLNAVQLVQDFEGYANSGTAWHQGNSQADRAGFRGDFYQEYYAGSGSSPWAGSGWTLMGGGGEQANLKTDGGHTGTKYASFKSSKTYAMRYMQFGLFDGTADKQFFRGSTFSFWAKTTNTSAKIRVTVFNTPTPTLSNEMEKSQCRRLETIEVGAVGTWKHYEVPLNPNLSYYGYSFMLDHNDIRDGALYVDDVEIYTANPYATYAAPAPAATLPLNATYQVKFAGIYNAQVTTSSTNAINLSSPGLSVDVNGTYVLNGSEVTMTFNTDTYVGTVKEDGRLIEFKSVSGNGMAAAILDGNDLNMVEFAENAESYASDGAMYYQNNMDNTKISGARGAWHCDYYQSGAAKPSLLGDPNWTLMGGSGDQLQLDTTTYVDGAQSLKMKFSTAGGMRYIPWDIMSGQARARTGYNRFNVYLKNANAYDVKIKLYVMKVAKVTVGNWASDSTKITTELTIPASTDWTRYSVALDASAKYYGFGIYMVTTSNTGFLHVDTAYFDNDYEGVDLMYYAIPGLPLTADLGGHEATITFGQKGAANFKCADLSVNANGTYTARMNGMTEEMVFTIGDNVITGSYAFNMATMTFTFTVISATGSYSAYLPADTVFSYTFQTA